MWLLIGKIVFFFFFNMSVLFFNTKAQYWKVSFISCYTNHHIKAQSYNGGAGVRLTEKILCFRSEM